MVKSLIIFGLACLLSCDAYGYPQNPYWRNQEITRQQLSQDYQPANGYLISVRVPTLRQALNNMRHAFNEHNSFGRINSWRQSGQDTQVEYGSVKGYSPQVLTTNQQEMIATPDSRLASILVSPRTNQETIVRTDHHTQSVDMINRPETSIHPAIPLDIPSKPVNVELSQPVNIPTTVSTHLPAPVVSVDGQTSQVTNDIPARDAATSSSSPVSSDLTPPRPPSSESLPVAATDVSTTSSSTTTTTSTTSTTRASDVPSGSVPKEISSNPKEDMKENATENSVDEPKKPEATVETSSSRPALSAVNPIEPTNQATNQSTATSTIEANTRTELNQPEESNQDDSNSDQSSGGSNITTYSERMEIEDKP